MPVLGRLRYELWDDAQILSLQRRGGVSVLRRMRDKVVRP